MSLTPDTFCSKERWYVTRRTSHEAQPDRHQTDAGAGKEKQKESVEMRLHGYVIPVPRHI